MAQDHRERKANEIKSAFERWYLKMLALKQTFTNAYLWPTVEVYSRFFTAAKQLFAKLKASDCIDIRLRKPTTYEGRANGCVAFPANILRPRIGRVHRMNWPLPRSSQEGAGVGHNSGFDYHHLFFENCR